MNHRTHFRPTPCFDRARRVHGTSLLEGLVALLVLALTAVGIAQLQGHLRLSAEVARQRTEAVRLAQQDIESLRAFGALAAGTGTTRSFEAIAGATRTVDAAGGYATPTRYTVTRTVDGAAMGGAKRVQVLVAWADRAGAPQQVALNTLIAAAEPSMSGALGLRRGDGNGGGVASDGADGARGPFGRSVRIPFGAKDLGDGSSAFKPVGDGTLAFRFDNRSGLPTGRCASVAATTRTIDLSLANLGPCAALAGRWVSGVIRFSSALPPDAATANDTPLPLAVTLAVALAPNAPAASPVPASSCTSEAMKTVAHVGAAGSRIESVPLAATPAALGLATWAETGERFVAYHCVVEAAAGVAWSAHVTLVPNGWRIGSAAGDRRVCRHGNEPASAGPLAHRNLLVIDAAAACPTGRAVAIAGNNASDVYVDTGTAANAP
jgi:Tfp pilus assembly protein PilV